MLFRTQSRQLANKNTTCFQVERKHFNKLLQKCCRFWLWSSISVSFMKCMTKRKEGNREPFSTCISGTVAWRGPLVLVQGQTWLFMAYLSSAVHPWMPPCPRICSPEAGAFGVYILPVCEICASVPSSFRNVTLLMRGRVKSWTVIQKVVRLWPLVYLWLMAPKCVSA